MNPVIESMGEVGDFITTPALIHFPALMYRITNLSTITSTTLSFHEEIFRKYGKRWTIIAHRVIRSN